MPQQKRDRTNAAGQAAYQKRRAPLAQQQREKGLSPLPVAPSLPGSARWKAARTQAAHWLWVTDAAMQDDQAARSQRGQESEWGEAFTQRLHERTQLIQPLETRL